MTDLVSQLVGALDDLIGIADVAMRSANRDGAEYDRDAELAEARSALTAAKAGGWQDISTAPKDGTEILLLFGNAEYILSKPHGRVRAACWTGSGSSANWSIPYFKDDSPTHWQPIPAPPAQRGEG